MTDTQTMRAEMTNKEILEIAENEGVLWATDERRPDNATVISFAQAILAAWTRKPAAQVAGAEVAGYVMKHKRHGDLNGDVGFSWMKNSPHFDPEHWVAHPVAYLTAQDTKDGVGISFAEMEALYHGQCELTDRLAVKAEGVGDAALNQRIKELEANLSEMNKRFVAAQAESHPAPEPDATKVVSVPDDTELLDFVAQHPEMTLRCHKKRWVFIGFTNYEYEVFKTPREAIAAALAADRERT